MCFLRKRMTLSKRVSERLSRLDGVRKQSQQAWVYTKLSQSNESLRRKTKWQLSFVGLAHKLYFLQANVGNLSFTKYCNSLVVLTSCHKLNGWTRHLLLLLHLGEHEMDLTELNSRHHQDVVPAGLCRGEYAFLPCSSSQGLRVRM